MNFEVEHVPLYEEWYIDKELLGTLFFTAEIVL